MSEIMKLYNTYLGPASDTLLDLGASGFRWNNLYIYGTLSATNISASSINTTVLTATSSNITSEVVTRLAVTSTASIGHLISTSGIRITSANKGLTETVAGDIWYDTTRKTIMAFTNSSRLALEGILFVQTGNGIVANNASEATLIGSGFGSTTLSPDFFVPGKSLRITASGLYETQIVPVSLNVRVRLGGLTGTQILATGDQTPAGALTGMFWRMVADLTCVSTGATGMVIGQSAWEHQSTATGSPINWQMTNTGVTINTTTALIVQFTADWGAGVAAADSMMCTNFTLESIN